MERLYVQRAYADIEMAERLGVDRTTVFKDRRELERSIPFIDVEPGRWKIDRTRYLSEIRVNLHEALALYLAARRASRQTRIAQPHVASALEKLAAALKQPMTEQLVKAASAVLIQSIQPARVAVVETVTQAWVEHRKVRITHRSLHGRRTLTYVVSPYLIEPSLWGDGAYVIGHSDVHAGLATFKIERIEHAFLTSDTFTIPDTFDDQELLRHTWGI
jgi:predicted DNA-binding transcriptional regulator YafY